MPLVDANDREININEPWCLQSPAQQQLTLDLIEAFRGDLIETDFPRGFEVTPLTSGRVLLTPLDEEPLVCYLHDPNDSNARLVLDDFTPEIWEEWWVSEAVRAVKPKNLSGL